MSTLTKANASPVVADKQDRSKTLSDSKYDIFLVRVVERQNNEPLPVINSGQLLCTLAGSCSLGSYGGAARSNPRRRATQSTSGIQLYTLSEQYLVLNTGYLQYLQVVAGAGGVGADTPQLVMFQVTAGTASNEPSDK